MSINPAHAVRPGCIAGSRFWGSVALVGVSGLLYMFACAMPAMVFDQQTWPGVQVLALGWLGLLLGQIAWFGNLFWALSLLFVVLHRWMMAAASSGLALLLALDALLFRGSTVPLDEAGVNTMIFQSYQVGFYLWIASIAAVGLGAALMLVISSRAKSSA